MTVRSWGGRRRWLAVLTMVLGVFGAGGVARAAEQIAADAPIGEYSGPFVYSPYTESISHRPNQLAGQSVLSNVVPTVGGRLSRVTVYVAYRSRPEQVPVAQNLFVDLARVDAEGRPTEVLGSASVQVSGRPYQLQGVATDVVFGVGPQVIAGERYALVYRADGCCLVAEAAQETASVPDGWIGTIDFGTTTTNWSHRLSDHPNSYPGTIGVRMWVDSAPANALEGLLDPLLPAPRQPAVPQQPPDAPPLCGRPVMLISVTLHRREVRLAGVARAVHAGAPVTISAAGRPVAVAIVAPDGTFRTTAQRTRNAAKLRYQARLEDEQSAALRATRLLIIDSQTATPGGVRVRGRLISRRRAHRTLAVTRQLGCSGTRTPKAKIVRTDRRGRFSVTLPTPPADELIAVYRLRTTSGGKTYTLPLVLRTP